jgi:hypothetical protein
MPEITSFYLLRLLQISDLFVHFHIMAESQSSDKPLLQVSEYNVIEHGKYIRDSDRDKKPELVSLRQMKSCAGKNLGHELGDHEISAAKERRQIYPESRHIHRFN